MIKKLFLQLLFFLVLLTPSAFSASLKDIECGTATIASSASSTTATVSITDTSKAFLVYSYHGDDGPQRGLVGGTITNGTTLTFSRGGSPTFSIPIKYCVVEFNSGVSVQRGSTLIDADPKNVTITSVNTSKSFLILNGQASAGTTLFSGNTFILGRLSSSTNLELDPNSQDASWTSYWEVVEWDTASVQRINITLTTSATSNTGTISSVNTTQSFLQYSIRPAGNPVAGEYGIRCELTNSTTVTCDRGTGTNTFVAGVDVVTIPEITVQRGNVQFSTTDTTKDVTITSVDTSRAFPLSGHLSLGKSSYTTDESIGPLQASAELTSATNLQLVRTETGSATLDIAWQVVEFTASTTSGGQILN